MDYLIDEDPAHTQTIEQVDAYLLSINRPKTMDTGHAKNYLAVQRKQYEKLCFTLQKQGVDIRGCTVFQFYTALELFEKKST